MLSPSAKKESQFASTAHQIKQKPREGWEDGVYKRRETAMKRILATKTRGNLSAFHLDTQAGLKDCWNRDVPSTKLSTGVTSTVAEARQWLVLVIRRERLRCSVSGHERFRAAENCGTVSSLPPLRWCFLSFFLLVALVCKMNSGARDAARCRYMLRSRHVVTKRKVRDQVKEIKQRPREGWEDGAY